MHIQSNLLQNNYFLVFVLFLELGTTPQSKKIYIPPRIRISIMKFSQKSLVIFLLILLVLALGYIIFDKYSQFRAQEELQVYQDGIQYGYQQAIVQMMQQLATCQTVPLYAGNQTITAVAVECLQAASQEQGAGNSP